ncbi:MAG: 3-phosphoshikimate 1-carboxyvinyltransferase, partial [Eggerthellaceae bacterium]|nr:3-phosphoshikimate 1-carboxyvinyltransferase [Eggerthellaceae bacterium]
VEGLELLGVDAWIDRDDLYIEGQPGLQIPKGVIFDSKNDHRLAMTWALVGLAGNETVQVTNFDSVKISYPHFLKDIERLAQ